MQTRTNTVSNRWDEMRWDESIRLGVTLSNSNQRQIILLKTWAQPSFGVWLSESKEFAKCGWMLLDCCPIHLGQAQCKPIFLIQLHPHLLHIRLWPKHVNCIINNGIRHCSTPDTVRLPGHTLGYVPKSVCRLLSNGSHIRQEPCRQWTPSEPRGKRKAKCERQKEKELNRLSCPTGTALVEPIPHLVLKRERDLHCKSTQPILIQPYSRSTQLYSHSAQLFTFRLALSGHIAYTQFFNLLQFNWFADSASHHKHHKALLIPNLAN